MKSTEIAWRRVARRQHAAISRAQLLSAGLSRRQIERRTAEGALLAVHRGVYRIAGAPQTTEQALWSACLATGGIASHRSAAWVWDLRGCEPDVVEVTVPVRRRPDLAGVTSHTTRRLDAVDVCTRSGIPVTTPARTLLDLGAVLAADRVEPALEDALHRALVTTATLERTLARAGAMGRDGTATLRALLAARAPGQAATESPLEDEVVRVLRRACLPDPVRQHVVRTPAGRQVRLDLAYPRQGVAIEAQGAAWHTGRAALQRDCERLNILIALGWRVLAFTADDVRRRPANVVDAVRAVLFGAGTTATVASTPRSRSGPVP